VQVLVLQKIPEAKITLTADAYIVKIKDRVVLTDQFSRPGGTPVAHQQLN
jgi:iron complex outermembrane receptor protein